MTNSLEPSHLGGTDPSSSQLHWRWRLEDAAGKEVGSGISQGFPSQSDAESWVGEVWRELLEEGVDAVTLLEGDREVYGPMSLRASS